MQIFDQKAKALVKETTPSSLNTSKTPHTISRAKPLPPLEHLPWPRYTAPSPPSAWSQKLEHAFSIFQKHLGDSQTAHRRALSVTYGTAIGLVVTFLIIGYNKEKARFERAKVEGRVWTHEDLKRIFDGDSEDD